MFGARMSDKLSGMLTIAHDVPELSVPALAALVRTGKVGNQCSVSLGLTVC